MRRRARLTEAAPRSRSFGNIPSQEAAACRPETQGMSRRRVGLVLGGLLLLLAALVLAAPVPREAPRPYRFGAILSETGRYAFVGAPGAAVLRATGGPFEIHDSAGDKTRALELARTLERDPHVLGIIGPATTDETLALIAENLKIPCLSISAADRSQPRSPWMFRLPVTSYHMAYQIGDHLARHNLQRVALISVDSGFGKGGRRELQQQAGDFNLRLVADVVSPDRKLTSKEARDLIQQALASRPQALVIWWSAIGAAELTVAARELKVAVPVYHSGGIASPAFLEATGTAADGVLFPGSPLLLGSRVPPAHPQASPIAEFTRFCEAHRLGVSTFGGYAWDAARLLEKAVARVGPNRAKIRAYLENLQGSAATAGVFHFSPEDHNGLRHDSFLLLEVKAGGWEPCDG